MESIRSVINPVGSSVGRPRKYEGNIKLLENDIETYFKECKKTEEFPTISGLALVLGCSRKRLIDWIDNEVEFSELLVNARTRIMSRVEQRLLTSPSGHVGMIFWLKNLGSDSWVDKQEIVNSGNERLIVNVLSYKDDTKRVQITQGNRTEVINVTSNTL